MRTERLQGVPSSAVDRDHDAPANRGSHAAFAPGVDASDLYIHEHAGVVDLYFSRVTCQDFDFDVYRVSGA